MLGLLLLTMTIIVAQFRSGYGSHRDCERAAADKNQRVKF